MTSADASSPGEKSMETEGIPIAYSALSKGTPVVTASARVFGVVEHVLEIPAEDLFDGIVIATDTGLRFVDRDQIEEITTARVRCTLTDEEAAALPAPDNPSTFSADATEHSGSSLHDRFGRMFRRAHWKRDA
jgi:hypothetical protein